MLPIEELDLSARTANALINNDIKTVRDLVMLSETASSEAKPTRVVSEAMSIPPAIAASQKPDFMSSAALIKAPALEEHAVENVHTGPVKPYFSAIKVET